MRRSPWTIAKDGARRVLGFAVILLVWETGVRAGLVNRSIMPAPSAVFHALLELASSGQLFVDLAASIVRVVVGFLIAAVVGLALGVTLGWFRSAAEVLLPVVEAIRPIPPIAWIPIAIRWFGIGNAPSYFIVFIGAVFPVFVNAFVAIRSVERIHLNAALSLGAPGRMLVTDVLLPASLPIVLAGLRIALGVGWMCVIAAELIAARSGLGYAIQLNRMMLETENVLVGMFTIGLTGLLMNQAMLWLERRVVPWRPAAR